MLIASVTSQLTSQIADRGAYAVFGLMALDALLPAGGELIMLYAGVLAAGAIAGHHASIFGVRLATGAESYLVLSLAGTLGYLAGSIAGWAIGARGGRELIERYGPRLHLGPQTFGRAERWFARHGKRAVLLGRLTPVVRSFISIPAGALGSPLPTYTALTLLGSLIWCFAFAAVGWAVGDTWQTFHHDFRYADYAAIAAMATVVVAALLHRRRRAHRRTVAASAQPEEGSG